MTPRNRLKTVLEGRLPDCVPVAPDFSNMIPARLTGKPFWDIYLYRDPPIWEAYIACAKHFDIDALMDAYFPLKFQEEDSGDGPDWETFIVERSKARIVTQRSCKTGGTRRWEPRVSVYHVDMPPNRRVEPNWVGRPEVPERWEPLTGVKAVDTGPEGLRRLKELMGEQGLVGVSLASTSALGCEADVYRYYDNPEKHRQWADERLAAVERRFEQLMGMEEKPDFFCVGGSGTLIFQTVEIFRQLALPAVKRAIELAESAGIPTHVHSCGPEREVVKIMAEETALTVIDPLEVPPMGDCRLAELKRKWGSRMTLKGNLHTTDVMLRGTPEEVTAASRQAIDDAAEGGRFILSTGDQCGRDTPDENLHAMIQTARTYGKY